MAAMIPRVIAHVDIGAVRHNLQCVRKAAPDSKIMAVVKADAYGHGSVEIARGLRELRSSKSSQREDWEADAFAVACLEEALKLREARIFAPIVVLEGVLSAEELRLCIRHDLQIVIHDHWQLSLLQALPRGAEAKVWFKFNSGMHRLGFALTQVPKIVELMQQKPEWKLCGWMTHLACADEQSEFTETQIAAFDTALQGIEGARSIANSAGIVNWKSAHRDWVRPGLMLYGASPVAGKTGADFGLKPAMTLRSRILSLRDCVAGDRIGYGGHFVVQKPMRVAVVAAGYADGFHRCMAEGSLLTVNGKHAPLIGRVSMDMITVDVTEIEGVEVGDAVSLWGDGLPVEYLAGQAGTLAYELFCGLTQRVRLSHHS